MEIESGVPSPVAPGNNLNDDGAAEAPLFGPVDSEAMQDAECEARRLNAIGLNVIPIRRGTKRTFGPWGRFNSTHLHPARFHSIFARPDLPVGLAVVCGAISRNLVVLDADTPEAFQMLATALDVLGLRTWQRSSWRGGQFWFLLEEGVARNVTREGYQIWGHDHYVLAPPSICERTGEVMHWVNPVYEPEPLTVSVDQIAHLGVELHRGGSTERRWESGLPPVAHRVLVERDATVYGADNSRAEYAACLSLLGVGMDEDAVMEIFARHRPPHYARVGAADFRRAILIPAMRSRDGGASRSPEGAATRDAAAYLARLESAPFPGRTGSTDKCVLAALARRMQLENRYEFRASMRELALEAGTSVETVRKALDRLTHPEIDAVRRVGRNSATGASLWGLNLDKFPVGENAPVSTSIVPGLNETAKVGHDVWHRKSLGKSSLWVLQRLRQHPEGLRAAKLARETGRCHSTVSRSLRQLAGEGLAFCEEDGKTVNWYPALVDVEDWQLDRIAHERGTRGSREAKSARFAEDRALYASQLLMEQMAMEELRQEVLKSPTGTSAPEALRGVPSDSLSSVQE